MQHQPGYPKNLSGLCIGVLSGDRVVFQGPVAKDTGLPRQKILHLIGITTPKVSLSDGEDEPFGYASREYLRSRLVGKELKFVVETNFNDLEIGHVLYEGTDITIGLLREGLAKIRGERARGVNGPKYEDAEDDAKDARRGLWSDRPEKQATFSRRLVTRQPKQLADELIKNPVKAIVDEIQISKYVLYFPSLGALTTLTSPELQVVILSDKNEGGDGKNNNAKEIRAVLEGKILNREVNVKVRGTLENGLSGYIYTETFDNRKIMLTFGYAKLSKDALNVLEVNEFKDLKTISQQAASKGRGLWKDQKDYGSKTQVLNSKVFVGRVVEIISADILRIINLETNESVRVYLSNVKGPILGKPFAFEARESLRKKCIGKKVKVEIEFSKNILVKKSETDKGEERNFVFATVFENNKNLGAALLEEGLATLQIPRVDEEFTKYFEELKVADEEGKKKRRGQHGEAVRVPVFNDITSGKDSKYKIDISKSKTIYGFLKDEKKLSGVVEVILNGSRFKIRMHQQSCYIILVLEGVRCLPNEAQFKRWSQQALEYSKDNANQRDVDIELTNLDKKGIFHGRVYIDKKDYAIELLERGLAISFGKSNPRYDDVESAAKKNKVGLWSTNLNLSSLKGEEDREYTPISMTKTLRMVEVASPNEIYFDVPNAKKPEVPQKPEVAKEVKEGEIYAAKFTDGVYYRAKVRKVNKNGTCNVFYLDYGNSDTVPFDYIGTIDKNLKEFKSSLFRCGLYGLDNVSSGAQEILSSCLDAQFKVEFKEQSGVDYNIIIHDRDSTVNEDIVAEGLAQVTCDNEAWLKAEKAAKNARRGIWGQEDD